MTEFALVFIPFLVILMAIFDFSFALFTRVALHNAVREGVRYAITANTQAGVGHDQSIKNTNRSRTPIDQEHCAAQFGRGAER